MEKNCTVLHGVFKQMGSFLFIVVKLYSYKDSGVRNLRKFKYFAIILDISVTREIRFN